MIISNIFQGFTKWDVFCQHHKLAEVRNIDYILQANLFSVMRIPHTPIHHYHVFRF